MNTHIVIIARKSNIFKVSVLPKLTYRFNTIPIKIPARFFCTHREAYSKIYKESHGLKTAKPSWQESSGGITHLYWGLLYPYSNQGRDINAAMEENKDSRNRATEIQSIIVGKGEKAIQWRE